MLFVVMRRQNVNVKIYQCYYYYYFFPLLIFIALIYQRASDFAPSSVGSGGAPRVAPATGAKKQAQKHDSDEDSSPWSDEEDRVCRYSIPPADRCMLEM
jgi:hypothetical protein